MGSKTVDSTLGCALWYLGSGDSSRSRGRRGLGIYFFEAVAAAALQSPRVQLLSFGVPKSVKPSRNPRLGDQETKWEMAGSIDDMHDVESAADQIHDEGKPEKQGSRWESRSDG